MLQMTAADADQLAAWPVHASTVLAPDETSQVACRSRQEGHTLLEDTLTILLAGGSGKRLHPLTTARNPLYRLAASIESLILP